MTRCQTIGLPAGACAVARAEAVATLATRRTDRRRDWYRIENSAEPATGPVDLYIYDEIVSQEEADFCGVGTSAAGFVGALKELRGKELNLHINSPGGLVFDGIAIYNAVLAHDAPVHGYIDGLAASIASVVAMGCTDLTMSPHAMLMIHEPFGMTVGNAADHEQQAIVLNKMADAIAGVYGDRGKAGVDWRAKMAAETWLSDTDAVSLGLADRVGVATSNDAPMKDAFDLSKYRNAPKHALGATGGRQPVFLAMNALTTNQPAVAPNGTHAPMTGTHSHGHAAYGMSGEQQMHSHSHNHSGDANHGHHDPTGKADPPTNPNTNAGTDDPRLNLKGDMGMDCCPCCENGICDGECQGACPADATCCEGMDAGAARATLADQAEHVLADVQAFTDRLEQIAALRAGDGRTLSAVNVTRLQAVVADMDAAAEKARALVKAAAAPPKEVSEIETLRSEYRGLRTMYVDMTT